MEVLLKPEPEDEKMKEPLIYAYERMGGYPCCGGTWGGGTA